MLHLFFITILFTRDCYSIGSDYVMNVKFGTNYKMLHTKTGDIPVYWDWRDLNKVTPVKDQMNCNACWAFSAIANIESHLMIYKNMSESLSEQFLMDCDGRNVGCSSSSILNTFSTIVEKLGGVLRETDYKPYRKRILPCSWNHEIPVIPVVGYRRVRTDEVIMAYFIYNYGPLSAGINSASMAVYKGGIDEPSDDICSPREMNHAVLIVGYNVYVEPDTRRNVPYWIIKNSWGTNWGDKGYYYLVRGRNACGIANDLSFSIVN
ncbi:cathepsin F-like [Vanessa atalanta]|uniref:cathepsin F-like n=1 Tax=Vanessa atalanta TaxID=42275 RepID=UPI001FCD549B|nr:cathepsin F-like [Vanessa atalanta]